MEVYTNPYNEKRKEILATIKGRSETKAEHKQLEELYQQSIQYSHEHIQQVQGQTELARIDIANKSEELIHHKDISIYALIKQTTETGRTLQSLYKIVRQMNKALNEEARRRAEEKKNKN